MNQWNENQRKGQPTAPPQQKQMVSVEMPNRAPYVTYTLIAITIIFYLLQIASEYLLGTDVLINYGARYNEAIQAGQLWRFLTPALLHASIPHILFNMYAAVPRSAFPTPSVYAPAVRVVGCPAGPPLVLADRDVTTNNR